MIRGMNGIIDEVVLVKKALGAAEIGDLMNDGIAGILAVEPADKLAVTWGNVRDN